MVPVREVHAPAYSLWLGGRAGLLAFGGSLYINDTAASGSKETTGNVVGPGVGLEIDAGARLAKRYVPYIARWSWGSSRRAIASRTTPAP